MTIYPLDSWDSPVSPDNFAVEVDGTSFSGWELVIFHSLTPLTDYCGTPFTDFPPFTMYIYMPHTASSLTIKLINLLNEGTSNESLGMRDLIITFVELASPEQRSCGISSISLPYNACPCPQTNQYMDPPVTGICHPCYSLCATCSGPAINNCYSCYPGWYLSGSQCFLCNGNCATCVGTATTCTSCVQWRFLAHSQCFPTCVFPLYSSVDTNSVTWCNTPCPSSVAYWDGTCHSSCTSSFIMKDYGAYFVCVPNCPTGSYISPAGTCILTCNPEYSYPVMRVGIWFCEYRCPAPDYLSLPDGSCVLACPLGTTQDDSTRSCQPCQDSLCEVCPVVIVCTTCISGASLDDGSSGLCQICSAMLTSYDRPVGGNSHQYLVSFAPKGCELSLGTVKDKLKPTVESQKRLPEFTYAVREVSGKKNSYYMTLTFKDSVLKDSELDVTLEYLSGTLEIPKTLVSSTDFGDTSSITQTALKVAAAVGIGSTAVLSKTGPVWSMINFQQFIGYFIYINIEYPPQVEFLLSLFTFTDWSFLPNPFASMLKPIINKVEALQRAEVSDKYLPPMKFVRYGMTAFFIENGMGAIIINVALHLFLLFIRTLKKLSSRLNEEKIVNWIYVRLRWTIVFRNFLETAIPLALATFLQVRKLTFETSASTASVMSALFSFGCLAGTLLLMLGILEERSPEHLNKRKVRRIHGALYEGIDLNNCIAKYYNLLILLRGLVLIFLISFVDIEPLIQIIPLVGFNIGLVIYSALKTVFEDKYLNKINLLKEMAILIAEVGILFLYLNLGGETYNKILGWAIFCPLAFAAVVEVIYVFIGILFKATKLFKSGYSRMNKKLNNNHVLEDKKLKSDVKIDRKVAELQTLPPTQQPFDYRSRETQNTQNEIYQQRVQRARRMRVKKGPPVINNQDNNNNRGRRLPLPPGVNFRMRMKMNARFKTSSTSDLTNNSSFITRDNY